MKKYLNGKMVEMSQSELAAYEAARAVDAPETEITTEERIEALEAAFLEFVEVVLNG